MADDLRLDSLLAGLRHGLARLMTTAEFADMAAAEVCERMARALVDINDACAGEDEPLTPRQKTLVGTAILRECLGLSVDLERMFHAATVLEKWTMPQTPIGDEVEQWLTSLEDEGPLQ